MLFRCVLASLYEGVSVRPSVGPYVRLLALRKNRRGTHLIARLGLFYFDSSLRRFMGFPSNTFLPYVELSVFLFFSVETGMGFTSGYLSKRISNLGNSEAGNLVAYCLALNKTFSAV